MEFEILSKLIDVFGAEAKLHENVEDLKIILERNRVNTFNARIGDDDGLGIHCDRCKGKGRVAELDADSRMIVCQCRCAAERQTASRLKKAGLLEASREKTFDGFVISHVWQNRMKRAAMAYAEAPSGWLAFFGQSGCGKTHLCTAAFCEIVRRHKIVGEYLRWNTDARSIKAAVLDRDDTPLEKFKRAPLLYIDDLFKTRDGAPVTDADVRLAFELLDHRYNAKMPTILSCEKRFDALVEIDQAIAGRVREMCGERLIAIDADDQKNYRFYPPAGNGNGRTV